MALLEARGIRHSYGRRTVVEVERLDVHDREVVAILGPNGSGKSTLFRLLLGLERPDAGLVTLGGESVLLAAARQRMAGVFQRPYLFAGTVADNVGYGLRSRGLDKTTLAARVTRALSDVGLGDIMNRDRRELSGGEVQRIALARAVACEPRVLLLDEPTANLDVTAQRRFREDLVNLVAARPMSVVLITHDPRDAFMVADRIAVMEGGSVVQIATPLELTRAPTNAFVAAFTGAELMLNGAVDCAQDGLTSVRVTGGQLIWVATDDVLPSGTAVSIGYHPVDVALSVAERIDAHARNEFALEVQRVNYGGAIARITLGGAIELASVMTRPNVEALGIVQGSRVCARINPSALRLFMVRPG